MTTLSLEDLRRNPDLLYALHAQARRARSEHVHCLLRNLLAALGARSPQPQLALRTAPCG